jgi:hypothetical protein
MLGGFLYEKIGFEWAAAIQGVWALISVSNHLFFFFFFHFLTFWRNLTWRIYINSTFHCVKGTSNGLILSSGALKEKKKVWPISRL